MKRIGEKRRLRNLVAAVSVGLIAGAFSILPVTEANPVLDSKGAAVSIAGTTDMSITSTAANNVIKWIDFSIGAGEKVAFDSHNYLNYVTGHARSDILGTLTGGGSIYIVNPNGILIGDGAQVDVGSLYLSTRNLTTEQLAGFDTATAALFKTDSLSGDVINMGKLNADVISVEGHNITFKNVADVTKNVVVNEEITGTAANDSVTLTAHGGEIHLGYAVGTEATEVNASQYTDTQTPALNGWHLAGADPDYYMLVRNKYELQNMQNNLSGNYMLANTIDMSGVNFAPIGNSEGNYFRGNFNGLEHEIRNLCINADDAAQYVGLFGVNSGTIRNVGLVGGSITGTVNSYIIGSIAGRNEKGTIENVFNTGAVKADNSGMGGVGGIVGSNHLGTIRNAYNTGAVTSTSTNNIVGGIAGENSGGTIGNVFNTGAITGEGTNTWLGGIVGKNEPVLIHGEQQHGGSPGDDPQINEQWCNGTITNAYNTGTVTSSGINNWVGGIAGNNFVHLSPPSPDAPPHMPDESNIKNVYNTGTVSGTGTTVIDGGIVGDGARAGNAYTSEDGDLKKETTFQGFDFSENGAWRIYEDKTTPLLTAFMKDKDEVISAVYDGSKDVGTYTVATTMDGTGITQTGDNAINWHGLSIITPAAINVSFADTEKVYDGDVAATAGTATLAGKVGNDDVSLATGLIANFEDKNVGNGKTVNYTNIALTGTKAGNYTLANVTAEGEGAITAKNITVSFADISKTYDGTITATAGEGTLTGVENVDTGKVGVTASAAYVDKNAGTNKQVDYTNVALTGAEACNYSIADTATGKGQINRANLTISVKDYSREYDGTTSASGAELQVTSGTLYAGDTISGGTKVFDTKDVGTGKTITVSEVAVKDSAGNANNYNISYVANTNSVITPKTLTVNFADISKTYDGTTSATAGAGTLNGVEDIDSGKVSVSASASYDDKNAGTNKQVDYTNVTLGGDEAGNYIIAAAATGTGVIIPKAITATFADISKTYDGTTSATAGAGTLNGVEAVDTGKVSVTASAAYADKNAGTDKQVDYSNVTLTGDEAGNYSIANTATGKGQIDRANLTISVKDYSREYDGSTSASGAELQVTSGTLYAGDTISGGTKVFDTKNVGTGKTITVSEVTVKDSTGNANNYNISYAANTNSAITPKNLTVNFADISKTYDGTMSATAGAGTLNGVEDIDSGKVSVSASAAYADKNAGTNKQVDYTNVTLGGDEAGNYTIAAVATGTGVITPKAITATFADISKTYDGTITATAGEGTLTGVENVDTGKVGVTASAAYVDKNAGTNKQVDYTNVALTGDEAGNYTIANTATGKGQINRANLTVSVKDYSREYDGTINADGAELSVTSGTLYVGDTISGGTKVFDTKDVGTGKTITISGVSINDGNNGDNYAVTYQPNTNSVITALPQSEPENPQPSQPEPGKPEPVNPEPSNPEPSNPKPVNPEPSNPEPSNPEPVNTDPSQEQQLAETGNAVADIESATEKLGAEEVHEMEEKLAAPKHEALEVTDEKSGDDENEKKQSKK